MSSCTVSGMVRFLFIESAPRGIVRHAQGEPLSLLHLSGIHPEDFPDMAVRIFEAAREHEPVILGSIGLRPSGLNRFVRKLIHLRFVLDEQGRSAVQLSCGRPQSAFP